MKLQTYNDAVNFAAGRKRKLANNTYFVDLPDGDYGVRLHDTVIVTWRRDGVTVLDSGGWKTVTTKARMNDYMPDGYSIYQNKGVWYIRHHNAAPGNKEGVYKDGCWFDARWHDLDADPKAELALRKKVKQYAKTFVAKLETGQIPAPNGGDCWLCSMFPEKHPDTSHFQSHIDEAYYVPTLVLKAVEQYASPSAHDYVVACMKPDLPDADKVKQCWGGVAKEQVRRALQKHVSRGLGLA